MAQVPDGSSSPDPPPSRASSLPQGIGGGHRIPEHHRSTVGASLLAMRSVGHAQNSRQKKPAQPRLRRWWCQWLCGYSWVRAATVEPVSVMPVPAPGPHLGRRRCTVSRGLSWRRA
ncbi:hypothetical protein F7R20_03980 [Pseudomonas brassicacearum subsp. brassicacearum]|nr:hypothetical protein F7R20_03980 [Pseudomonas brassicacearum subsp. brassicacearum]QEO77969.1 hypothetical protein ELZ14_10505 [Pseudomonas brassicacearum]